MGTDRYMEERDACPSRLAAANARIVELEREIAELRNPLPGRAHLGWFEMFISLAVAGQDDRIKLRAVGDEIVFLRHTLNELRTNMLNWRFGQISRLAIANELARIEQALEGV